MLEVRPAVLLPSGRPQDQQIRPSHSPLFVVVPSQESWYTLTVQQQPVTWRVMRKWQHHRWKRRRRVTRSLCSTPLHTRLGGTLSSCSWTMAHSASHSSRESCYSTWIFQGAWGSLSLNTKVIRWYMYFVFFLIAALSGFNFVRTTVINSSKHLSVYMVTFVIRNTVYFHNTNSISFRKSIYIYKLFLTVFLLVIYLLYKSQLHSIPHFKYKWALGQFLKSIVSACGSHPFKLVLVKIKSLLFLIMLYAHQLLLTTLRKQSSWPDNKIANWTELPVKNFNFQDVSKKHCTHASKHFTHSVCRIHA